MASRMDGDKVAHGEVRDVTYDRPYRWYWNAYGEKFWMPADPVQALIFMEQGWSLQAPRKPEKKPTTHKMRNCSVYSFADATVDVSEVEQARMNRTPGEVKKAVPTATYYSANGDELPNLPADPESMKQYLELGLTLTPPTKTAGEVTQLRAV